MPPSQSLNIDRFISLASGIASVLLFMLQENGVLVGWITSLVLYLLILSAAIVVLWMHGIPSGAGVRTKWFLMIGAAILVGSLGSLGTYKQYRHEHPRETRSEGAPDRQAQLLALATLTQEGWKRGVENGTEYFELDRQPLPDMVEATSAFKALNRPVAIRLQSVPSLKDLHLLGEAHVCHDLGISASNLGTLDELASFTDLVKLRVSQTPFDNGDYVDASAIGKLTALKDLFLNADRLQSADFLSKLTNLEKLDLTATPVRTAEPLKGLHSLVTLNLLNSYITDLSWLPELEKLHEVSIGEPELPTFLEIKAPLHLKTIWVSSNHQFDTSQLPIDNNLQEAFFYGDPLDLSGLSKTPHLKKLYLQSLGIFQLGHLQSSETIGNLRELQELTIAQYDVSDIDFLRGCVSLKNVTLNSDPIRSIDALGSLSSVEDVRMFRLPISDISALLRPQSLKTLEVISMPVPADQIDQFRSRGVHLIR